MVHDILKPAAILCKTLQYDDVSVIDAIEALLKTKKSVEKLKSVSCNELPTAKKVVSRVIDANNHHIYTLKELLLKTLATFHKA